MRKIILILTILLSQTHFGQKRKEGIIMELPKEYQWKIINEEIKDNKFFIQEYLPEQETLANWTIYYALAYIKDLIVSNTDEMIENYKIISMEESPLSQLTILEKNDNDKNIWILFKVETPYFPNNPNPESGLYYIIQGENTLYTFLVSVKEKSLSQEFVNKWGKLFKESKLIYREVNETPLFDNQN